MSSREVEVSESVLRVRCGIYDVVISDDYNYASGSADNTRAYSAEYDLTNDGYAPSSKHAVRIEVDGAEVASCIVLAGGGASGVHEHSGLIHDDSCLVAVGSFVCRLGLPQLDLLWSAEVDHATCFGIHHSVEHGCFISHGELEIARLSYDGRIVWSAGGRDIFTNGFRLRADHVEAIDWNGEQYRVDLATGQIELTA